MRIFTILALSLCGFGMGAQSTSPQVISSLGGDYANATAQMGQTVGETSIQTESNGSNVLTQGFHQTRLQVISLDENFEGLSLAVFPNPVSDFLKVKTEGLETATEAQLLAMDGRLILRSEIEQNDETLIDMTAFADGTYQIIFNQNGEAVKRFSIIKNQ